MKEELTARGFKLLTFKDSNGVECTVQQSSSIESKIWLGAKEIGLKHFKAGIGWQDVDFEHTIEDHYVANNRMHLNIDQVKELIIILQQFVDKGEL